MHSAPAVTWRHRRSQLALMLWAPSFKKDPPLTFVLLHSRAVSPYFPSLCSSHANQIPKSLPTTFLNDGTINNFCGMQPVLSNTLTDWLTDWLTALDKLWLFFDGTTALSSSSKSALAHLLPSIYSIPSAARFRPHSGDPQVSFRSSLGVPQRHQERNYDTGGDGGFGGTFS